MVALTPNVPIPVSTGLTATAAQAAAAVSHDHIVTIHAVEEEQPPYLVMEFIDGVSLKQKMMNSTLKLTSKTPERMKKNEPAGRSRAARCTP